MVLWLRKSSFKKALPHSEGFGAASQQSVPAITLIIDQKPPGPNIHSGTLNNYRHDSIKPYILFFEYWINLTQFKICPNCMSNFPAEILRSINRLRPLFGQKNPNFTLLLHCARLTTSLGPCSPEKVCTNRPFDGAAGVLRQHHSA